MTMKRNEFVKKGLAGLTTIVALPTVFGCSNDEDVTPVTDTTDTTGDGDCTLSPSETAGPFPIKTPADLVRENIVSDRAGVALLITLTIQDQSNDCKALAGVFVD